jgi:hypothetical protein
LLQKFVTLYVAVQPVPVGGAPVLVGGGFDVGGRLVGGLDVGGFEVGGFDVGGLDVGGAPVLLPTGTAVGNGMVAVWFDPTPVTPPVPPSKTTSEQLKKFSLLSERTHWVKMMARPVRPVGICWFQK